MNRILVIASGALLAAAALTTTALALNSGDTSAHTIKVSHAKITGFTGTQTVSASARASFPRTWKQVSKAATHLTLREGSAICLYTVETTTGVDIGSADDATAAAHARTLAPATGAYVLEEGTRGSSAWRVTRVREDSVTHLHAVRVAQLTSMTQQLKLTGGRRAFQVITVDARSRKGDECHSGTYRDVAGPSIGDALATARTRAYVDFVPKR